MIKSKKAQQKKEEARKTAEITDEIAKEKTDKEAAEARVELEARRAYFYSLEGEFEGFSEPVVLPHAQSTLVVSTGDVSTEKNSTEKKSEKNNDLPEKKPGRALLTKMVVRVLVQNDNPSFASNQSLTAAQLRAIGDGLAWMVEIREESKFSGSQSVAEVLTCAQSGLRPDFKKGIIRFACQSGLASGRDYQISMDDEGINYSTERSPENVLSRSQNVSDLVVKGNFGKIRSMNVKLMTPHSKAFYGKLERK